MFNRIFNFVKLLVVGYWKSAFCNVVMHPDFYKDHSTIMMKWSGILILVGIIHFIAIFFTELTLGGAIGWFFVSMVLDLMAHSYYRVYLLQELATGRTVYSYYDDHDAEEVAQSTCESDCEGCKAEEQDEHETSSV